MLPFHYLCHGRLQYFAFCCQSCILTQERATLLEAVKFVSLISEMMVVGSRLMFFPLRGSCSFQKSIIATLTFLKIFLCALFKSFLYKPFLSYKDYLHFEWMHPFERGGNHSLRTFDFVR